MQCFSAPLQPEELAGVKKVVSQKMPQVSCQNSQIQVPGMLGVLHDYGGRCCRCVSRALLLALLPWASYGNVIK